MNLSLIDFVKLYNKYICVTQQLNTKSSHDAFIKDSFHDQQHIPRLTSSHYADENDVNEIHSNKEQEHTNVRPIKDSSKI